MKINPPQWSLNWTRNPLVRIVASVIGIVLIVLFINAQFADDDAIDTHIAEMKKFKEQADSALKFADSLKTKIVVLESDANAAVEKANALGAQVSRLKKQTSVTRGRADSLKEVLTDSVELARRVIPLQDSIIAHQDTTIRQQEKQVSLLTTGVAKKDTTITLLTITRDSLIKVIRNVPEPPKNPNRGWFGIKYPSRKSVGVAGAVIGAVVTFVVIK